MESARSGKTSAKPAVDSPGSCGVKIWDKKTRFFKNKAEKLLKTHRNGKKTNLNKPENKAENLLKTGSCGKKQTENKPENKAGHVIQNKEQGKGKPENN
ncbi:MAG TPA: hypothetical protein VFQ24_00360 [Terriglobia bacterium]|nr:hypothetical protein [Terriglobia bacterium]